MTPEQQQELAKWQAAADGRAHGRRRPVKRGARKTARQAAEGAWRCEGQWQVAEQMDIWACIDEAERDERRQRGEDIDEE